MELTRQNVWKIVEICLVFAVVAGSVYYFLNRAEGPENPGVGVQPPVIPSSESQRQFAEMERYMLENEIESGTPEEIKSQFTAIDTFREQKNIELPTQKEIDAQFKAMQEYLASSPVNE